MIIKEEVEEKEVRDKYSGEMVKSVRKVCKCQHVMYFITNKPAICRKCGRLVYPTKLCEFREKMKKELLKK